MRRAPFAAVVLLSAAGAALPACNALLGGEGSAAPQADGGGPATAEDGGGAGSSDVDAGGRETGARDGAGGDAQPDALAPDSPPDVACTATTWAAGDAGAGCASRKVHALARGVLDTGALSIARTGGGRVAVAFNSKMSADEGVLELRQFTPATPSFTITPATLAGSQFDDIGSVARVAAGAGDVVTLAYLTQPDGELLLRRLGPSGPPGASQVLASGVAAGAHVALAIAPNLDARIVWYAPGAGANPGKVSARLRTEITGDLGPPTDLTTSIVSAVRGAGEVSALVDGAGAAHVAYHFAQLAGSSAPRYAQQVGQGWTLAKTLDNQALEGIAGTSVALALVGQVRYAAYFVRKTGQTAAELRLASWVGQSDTPEVVVLDQAIPAPDPAALRYRVAMAADPHGLLHLAIVRPFGLSGGAIEYRRQVRVAGRVTWLTDVVDDAVLSAQSGDALVDLVVDASGRPHIAYVSGTTGDVFYATRYDR